MTCTEITEKAGAMVDTMGSIDKKDRPIDVSGIAVVVVAAVAAARDPTVRTSGSW
jgi:hypothetical protein